jgi:hypothetical protein
MYSKHRCFLASKLPFKKSFGAFDQLNKQLGLVLVSRLLGSDLNGAKNINVFPK